MTRQRKLAAPYARTARRAVSAEIPPETDLIDIYQAASEFGRTVPGIRKYQHDDPTFPKPASFGEQGIKLYSWRQLRQWGLDNNLLELEAK